jgi:hypothetical protein
MTGLGGWVTNDPAVAAKLRAADRRYELAKVRMQGMTLGEKIEAQRIATAARQAEYDAATQPAYRCPRGISGCACGAEYCKGRR